MSVTHPAHRSKCVLLLMVLMAGALLSACSQVFPPVPTPTDQAPATRPASPTAPAATRRPTRTPAPSQTPTALPTSPLGVQQEQLSGLDVLLWHPWQGEPGTTLQTLAQEFNRSNPWGIRLHLQGWPGYDALDAAMQQALAERQPPDLVIAYPHQALAWESIRPMVDLETYLSDPEWGLSPADQADFYPAFWQTGRAGERRIGLPALRSGQFLYYNNTLARQLGFRQPPASSEALRTQACAAAQAGHGGLILDTAYPTTLGWLAAFGADVLRKDGRGYQMDTPATRAAFSFLRKLYDENCAWLPAEEPGHEAFAGRQGLFLSASLSALPYQQGLMARQESPDEWSVLPFPGPFGDAAFLAYGPSFSLVSSNPVQHLAAWLALRALLQPEPLARLARAAGSLPLRQASLELLQDDVASNPQWAQALDSLPLAYPEPDLASWRLARWAVGDATTQLYRDYFSLDQVPELAKLLQTTVFELYNRQP